MSRKTTYLHADNFRWLTGRGNKIAELVEHNLAGLADHPEYGGVIRQFRQEADTSTLAPGSVRRVGSFTVVLDIFEGGDRVDALKRMHPELSEARGVPSNLKLVSLKVATHETELPYAVQIVFHRAEQEDVFMCDLPAVIDGYRSLKGSYAIYKHVFIPAGTHHDTTLWPLSYVGMTRQGWQARWRQHLQSAKSGSPYRFHEAIRQWDGRAARVIHHVLAAGLSSNRAMELEELFAEQTLYPKGLNMIPGGRAGFAYLQKLGLAAARDAQDTERRGEIVAEFIRTTQREGRSNPLLAARWRDDDFAVRAICAAENRLKPHQIGNARFLHDLGKPVSDIVSAVGARNELQIKRLLKGATYSRVKP